MLNTTYLLHIGFELVLFVIFVYYLTLLVKTYMVPVLQEQKNEEKQEFIDLKKKEVASLHECDALEQSLKKQDVALHTLNKKMDRSYKNILKKQQEEEQARKILYEKLSQKKEKQMLALHASLIKKEVLPQAFENTRTTLSKHFSGPHGHKLLASWTKKLIV